MYGCCRNKSWMDEQSMKIWTEIVWKPYVANRTQSVLLLDNFICRKQNSFRDRIKLLGTSSELILGGNQCVLQPCDVEIKKSLKHRIRKLYMKWPSSKYSELNAASLLPAPDKREMSLWRYNSFSAVSEKCIRAKFDHIGLTSSEVQHPSTLYPETPFRF